MVYGRFVFRNNIEIHEADNWHYSSTIPSFECLLKLTKRAMMVFALFDRKQRAYTRASDRGEGGREQQQTHFLFHIFSDHLF